MSSYVNNMKIGDKISVAMPYGRFNYLGRGICRIKEL
jgi:Na+-transporting NADH:ubiquinone oxidoreductase subunit NqrF